MLRLVIWHYGSIKSMSWLFNTKWVVSCFIELFLRNLSHLRIQINRSHTYWFLRYFNISLWESSGQQWICCLFNLIATRFTNCLIMRLFQLVIKFKLLIWGVFHLVEWPVLVVWRTGMPFYLCFFLELVLWPTSVSCAFNRCIFTFGIGGIGLKIGVSSQRIHFSNLILLCSPNYSSKIASFYVRYIEISNGFSLPLRRNMPLATFAFMLIICRVHLIL